MMREVTVFTSLTHELAVSMLRPSRNFPGRTYYNVTQSSLKRLRACLEKEKPIITLSKFGPMVFYHIPKEVN